MRPAGDPRRGQCDLPEILDSAERGQRVLSAQTYEVLNVVAAGDRIAVEVLWSGTLAVPYGDLPSGHVMRAHIGTFLDVRDGRISGRRSYDSYARLTA